MESMRPHRFAKRVALRLIDVRNPRTLGEIILEVIKLNNAKNEWKIHKLIIEKIEGEYQTSLSDTIKNSIKVFKEKNYNKILDLGCGTGRNSLFFAQHGFEVFASDISKESIDILRNKIHRKDIFNINIYNFSFENIKFENDFFDAVVCTSVLHHAQLKDIKRGIAEIFRVLKPKGCLILDMLSKDDLSYGLGKAIEENTFVGSREGEEGIPHHYTDIEALKKLLEKFYEVNIYKNEYIIDISGGKEYCSKVFDVIAFK